MSVAESDRQYIGSVMSNFDHEIDHEKGAELKHGYTYGQYAGWNFCGWVWYEPGIGVYKCEVWVYGSLVKEVEGKELQDIMDLVCDEFGSE